MRLGLMRLKYDQAGGAERTLGLLAQGLLDREHEVCVVTASWQGDPPDGVIVKEVATRHKRGYQRVAEFAQTGIPVMQAWQPHSFISLERTPGAPLIRAGDGCHAAWLEHRAPYEGFFKNLSFKINPQHKAFLDLEQRAFTSPALHKVIANSRLVADELQRFYGLGPERIEMIYNGVDKARLALARQDGAKEAARVDLGLDPERPVLLFLGSGFERKGLTFAIKALPHVPDALLLVAGKDRTARYETAARGLGVEARVKFLGQRDDAGRLMAASDAMVLPTIYDPCANACLESLAAGRPVVTTLANGASELVQPEVSGAIVSDPADDIALASACKQTLSLAPGFGEQVPELNEWVDRMAAVMERAVRDADGGAS
jgi:UDP-glucose:(heptosyl)LPS alpha-1,3-glucosyltransferase